MKDLKKYPSGGQKNSPSGKERIEGLQVAAGGAAMLGAGSFLYGFGWHLAENYGGGGATALAGMGGIAVGAVAVVYGTVQFVNNSPKLKKALIHGLNNVDKSIDKTTEKMNDYTKNKIKPFALKAMQKVKAKAKAVDNEMIPFEVDGKPVNWAAKNPAVAQMIRQVAQKLR